MNTDLVLVGGGLANSLIAYRLAQTRPDVDLLVVETNDELGGDHVWSFHGGDLSDEQRAWIEPMVEASWSGHEVRFPGFTRRIGGSYHSVTSQRLHSVISDTLGDRVLFGRAANEVSPRGVTLDDGTTIEAVGVIDGRGAATSGTLALAWQKFVGQVVELERPHGLQEPILMDATVAQRDGFRFVYTLPFAERRLLVEDTRYSDTPSLDLDELRTALRDHVGRQGWRVREVLREETGVLPIVLDGDLDAHWERDGVGVARSGMRAVLFHPTTGYSLPEAVRMAFDLGELPELGAPGLGSWSRERSRRLWQASGFFRFLNRMLFRAAEPDQRYRVLQRFYRLPEPLIHRFYAGRLTLVDRARILTGRPPVPLGAAIACLFRTHVPDPPRETDSRSRP